METRFSVYKENIQIKSKETQHGLNIKFVLKHYYGRMRDRNPELLKSFNTWEDAKEFFEKEKGSCQSYYTIGWTNNFYETDYIFVEEEEYNEYLEEWVSVGNIWDYYIKELPEKENDNEK